MLIAAAIAVGCGARQHPVTTETRAVDVELRGNLTVSSGTLRRGLSLDRALRTGQPFDPYLVGVDEDRLRGFYMRRGHFAVTVTSRIEESRDKIAVTFLIDEGPRARLRRVDLLGLPADPHLERDQLRDLIAMDDGDPFTYEEYELAKPKMIDALERAGYAHARVESTVVADRVLHEAVIRFEVEPGAPCRFGAIDVQGVDGALASAVRARLALEPGARYSTTALEEAQAALYEMGRFALVRIQPDRTDGSDVIPVKIELVPADRHELRLGGGVGVDPASADVHTRAGYSIAGWPRPLVTTRLELRPAVVVLRDDRDIEPRVEAIAAMERLDLFGVPRLRGEVETSFVYSQVEAYTSVGPRVRLGARAPLGSPRLQAGAGWQLRVLDFRDLDPAIDPATATALGLDRPYQLGFFDQSIALDLRDDRVAPRRGLYAELRAEEGTVAAGGAFTYLRLTPELRGYVSPTGKLVLASRLRVGGIAGDLPVTERYFAGGASSHRGFPERRLSPVATQVVDGVEESAVIGGGALVETGLEARHPIARLSGLDLGGVAFLDGGDVTERFGDLDPTFLHWAAGLGLRVATVIGPIRFDVGYRLNRADGLRWYERTAFHLSLGEAF